MDSSNYMTQSSNYAKQAQEDYENSLSYLITGLDEAKAMDQQAAQIRYQNLITQIEQQLPGIQKQFYKDAKAAYVQKEQNLQQINADLNRLGVNTQGFGVTQRLMTLAAYGQQYGDLTSDYNDALQNIENQKVNALGDLNADLADLDADYAKDKLETLKYIGEQGRDVYNTTYNNYYGDLQYQDKLKQQELENQRAEQERQDKLKQQEWENAFKEKQRQDQLKQQEFENQLALKQLALAKSSRSYSSGGSSKSSSSSSKDTSKILNTNYCMNPNQFSSSKAFNAYMGLINAAASNGGVSKNTMTAWFNSNSGVLSSSDISKIKKQFGY